MKFERTEETFRPVTITLETQEEADVLHALLGIAGGGYAGDLTYRLYSHLDKISDSRWSAYWTGSLSTKKD